MPQEPPQDSKTLRDSAERLIAESKRLRELADVLMKTAEELQKEISPKKRKK